MKIPVGWLADYLDIDVSAKELANAMTMSGSKVEAIYNRGEYIKNVVTGKIMTVKTHPDADKLLVAKVNTGNATVQIVTGAQNIKEGDIVPIALTGAELPGGKKIKKSKLRGVESNGMMCSIDELELTINEYPDADPDGIMILDPNIEPGIDITEALGLNEDVIEFEITPNRRDCYSVIGLAREAAATIEKAFKLKKPYVREDRDTLDGKAVVKIQDSDLCTRYTARIVEDIVIKPSPLWMRKRLTESGIRPINNIVDITNYVMLEYGQPMHAFDLDMIKDQTIIVRKANPGEFIETLDDQKRALKDNMLLIADPEKALGIAGVMGGAYSQITPLTKRILFESANFNGKSIRLTAKALGMRTESSGLFEKGLDPKNALYALERAAELVELLGAGKVLKGYIDVDYSSQEIRKIEFEPDKINNLLGTDISLDNMVNILQRLEIKADLDEMKVIIPSFRLDISQTADLAEEIARFYGYNNIKPTLLEGKTATQGQKTYTQTIGDIIKNTMVACGLYEICTYSFTSMNVFDKMAMNDNDERRNCIVITNPLGEDFKVMRTTCIPDMLTSISKNFNRFITEGGLFEVANIYSKAENDEVSVQKSQLTIGLYGEKYDFYTLKGIVESLFDVLGIKNMEYMRESELNEFHPGCTAKIICNNIIIGTIGKIHPSICENFIIPRESFCGIIDVENLAKLSSLDRKYKQLPKYPAVTRDLAMVTDENIPVGEIEKLIKARGGKILEDVKLFDIYRGKQVGEGRKSVAYSIVFRADDRTLQDSEVNKSMDRILESLQQEYQAELRK